MWLNNKSSPEGLLPGRQVIGPLLIIVLTNIFTMLVVHANTTKVGEAAGSLTHAVLGLWQDPKGMWEQVWVWPTQGAIRTLLTFWGIELLLMRVIPGKTYYGPITPGGNRPVYNANGMQCFFISVIGFLVGSYGLHWWEPTVFYDHYKPMIATLIMFAPVFCVVLYLKGLLAPSSSDCGSSGNPVIDFYWGTELYPRIFGWDVKQFTNCRFGMMAWALFPISFAAAQLRDHGSLTPAMAVNLALNLVYVAKFFWWETGYFSSMDIMHDRAGYYICWGCLVWIPSVYVSHSLFITNHPQSMSVEVAVAIFLLGWLSIYINYDVDRQRVLARETRGQCIIWGRKPDIIEAQYVTEKGETKTSILLTSGWWGVARHFHYVPELMAAFFWSCPGGFNHILPYFYFLFLVPLLFDRAFRDDSRCASKYGAAWEEYRRRVPSRVIPGII